MALQDLAFSEYLLPHALICNWDISTCYVHPKYTNNSVIAYLSVVPPEYCILDHRR